MDAPNLAHVYLEGNCTSLRITFLCGPSNSRVQFANTALHIGLEMCRVQVVPTLSQTWPVTYFSFQCQCLSCPWPPVLPKDLTQTQTHRAWSSLPLNCFPIRSPIRLRLSSGSEIWLSLMAEQLTKAS